MRIVSEPNHIPRLKRYSEVLVEDPTTGRKWFYDCSGDYISLTDNNGNAVAAYNTVADFPPIGVSGTLYLANDTDTIYIWDGNSYEVISSSGVVSVAGKQGAVVLNKSDVGLSNVDNTSDLNKPISTATQAALNAKESIANKGIANGYAPLDAFAVIPAANMRSYNNRGPLTAATTYNRWDTTLYRGRRVLVTGTAISGTGTNPFFSSSNYIDLEGETNIYRAYDFGFRADGQQSSAATNTTALQAAINAAEQTFGRVILPAGYAVIGSPGIELKSRVTVEGAGAYATILSLADNSNCHMFYNHVSTNGTSDPNAMWCGLMNLALDGRKSFQNGPDAYHAIYFNTNPSTSVGSSDLAFAASHIVFNVHIRNSHSDSVHVAGRSDVRLIAVKASFAGNNSFTLTANTHADHCISEQPSKSGFVVQGSSVQLTGCKSTNAGLGGDAAGVTHPSDGYGFYINGAIGEVSLSSCDSQNDAANGFRLSNVKGCCIAACTISEASYTNASDLPALYVDNSSYNNISLANRAGDDTSALKIAGGSTGNNIFITHSALPGKVPGTNITGDSVTTGNYIVANGALV